MANNVYNLGNVVGLIRSTTPPKTKPYLIWGKILDESAPLTVQLRIYKGSGDPALEANWLPILTAGQTTQVGWEDIEDKPNIFAKVKVENGKLIFTTLNGVEIDSEELSTIINGLPDFDPELWATGVAKQNSTTNLKALENAFKKIKERLEGISTDVGNKNALTTENKNSLVEALNELKQGLSLIDDTLTTSSKKTWSIDRIKKELKEAVDTLLSGVEADYDTLKELSDGVKALQKEVKKINNSTNAVLYSEQDKTENEKKIARKNIGVVENIFQYSQNEAKSPVFSGAVTDLQKGNYVVGIGELTGVPAEVLSHTGKVISALVTNSITEANEVSGLVLLMGKDGFAYKQNGETEWKRLARVGDLGDNIAEELSEVKELTADNVTNKSVELSYDIDSRRRLDVFCNGVLLSPYAVSVDTDNAKKLKFNDSYIPFELEAGDELIVKFIKKK